MSSMINHFMQYFSRLEKPKIIIIAYALIAVFGIIDYVFQYWGTHVCRYS